jgi:hypothetical protein
MIKVPVVTVLHRNLVTEVVQYLHETHIIIDKLCVHEWNQSFYQV